MQPSTVEANYQYSPLPEGHIRLLRLSPHRDVTAPMRGEIFDYPLLNLLRSTHHQYEALSYAWGSPEKTRFISINNSNLPVTTNLYSALLRLRDPLLERTLWIDAICINQQDKDERRLQVQFMAMIYTMASHVVVWLGEAETNSERALETIHRAAYSNERPTENDPTVQNAVLELLQQPWFKRIWVLQEVAAARSILIMYGSIEIDGHTFCLGVSSLSNVYKGNPDLKSIIPTALYLIGRTVYRHEQTPIELPKYSLNISTLAELLDTYHAREASDRHDKIYALLGMSSDGYSSGGFSPDYTALWSSLFQQVIQFILGEKQISIRTWDNKDVAIIKSKGYTLGKVSEAPLVESSSVWGGRQTVVISKAKSNVLDQHDIWEDHWSDKEEDWKDVWTLELLAKPIQSGDILCLLEGATKPTLIRPYKDYFIIIAIAVRPINIWPAKKKVNGWPNVLQMIVDFPRNFMLIWDWKELLPSSENKDEGDPFNHQALRYGEIDLRDILDGRELLINTALILGDVLLHERAKMFIKKAIEDYKTEFGDEHLHTLRAMQKLAWIYKKSNHLQDDSVSIKEGEKLEAIAGILGRQGYYNQITTKKMAHLTRNYDEEVITLLLDRRGNEITITEEIVKAAATNKRNNKEMLALLLDRREDDITITEKIIEAAAGNFYGDEAMKVLLNYKMGNIIITESIINAAARNSRNGFKIMKRILRRREGKITITGKVVETAAESGEHGETVMSLLLNQQRDQVIITEEAISIVARKFNKKVVLLFLGKGGNKVAMKEESISFITKKFDVEVLELLLQQHSNITITSDIVKAAAGNYRSEKVMKLLLDQHGDKITITDEIVRVATENEKSGMAILRLLLDRRGNEIIITEEVLKAMAKDDHVDSEKAIKQLFDQRGDKIKITEGVMKAAAENQSYGMAIMQFFLDRRGDEIILTEEIIRTMARNSHDSSTEAMKSLLHQRGDEISITAGTIAAAAENRYHSTAMLQLLLDQRGDEVMFTWEAIKAIIASVSHGRETTLRLYEYRSRRPITEDILYRYIDKIPITEDIIKSIAGHPNHYGGTVMMKLLLNQRGNEITITEEIVKAAARNNMEMMIMLLKKRGNTITITEAIIQAAAENNNALELVELLLDQCGNKIAITEELIRTMAAKEYLYSKEIITLLLNRQGDKIPITEEVITAVAKREQDGKEIMELFLRRRGDKIHITEGIVWAAAANEYYYGDRIMKLLLDQRGYEITITEKIVRAVAASGHHHTMEMLLGERGDEIIITENIVQAVAANEHYYGTEMMKLLLDERGDEITITERIIKAAAGNESNGERIIKLLLNWNKEKITMTEQVIEVAAANKKSGRKIIELLLSRRGEKVIIQEEILKVANSSFLQEWQKG